MLQLSTIQGILCVGVLLQPGELTLLSCLQQASKRARVLPTLLSLSPPADLAKGAAADQMLKVDHMHLHFCMA